MRLSRSIAWYLHRRCTHISHPSVRCYSNTRRKEPLFEQLFLSTIHARQNGLMSDIPGNVAARFIARACTRQHSLPLQVVPHMIKGHAVRRSCVDLPAMHSTFVTSIPLKLLGLRLDILDARLQHLLLPFPHPRCTCLVGHLKRSKALSLGLEKDSELLCSARPTSGRQKHALEHVKTRLRRRVGGTTHAAISLVRGHSHSCARRMPTGMLRMRS